MKNDGTAEKDLEDVGAGIGQSHRYKLLEDASVQQDIERSDFRGHQSAHRRPFRNKGCLGNRSRKLVVKQQAPPVTRKRVPKGQSTTKISAKVGIESVSISVGKAKPKSDGHVAGKASESFQRQQ